MAQQQATGQGGFVASARRFRPMRFDQVVGQDHVVRAICGALKLERLAAAYLFYGCRGVGKTTIARLIAKAVNCTRPDGVEPCNQCPACVSINNSTCMDVIEIDAASHTGVDNMREVCETVQFPPSAVRNKILIIDECHMLSKGAFNAFLKTLEEPPPHVVFVLATTEPEKVPDTITSRCQPYRFAPARMTDLVDNLQRALDRRDDVKLSEGQRNQLVAQVAKAAAGSFRDGLSLLDQVLAVVEDADDIQAALDLLGVTPWEVLDELTTSIANKDAAAALATLDQHLRAGVDLAQLVQGLAEYLRAIMLSKVCESTAELVALPEEALAAAATHAQNMKLDTILRSIDLCWDAAEHFRQEADQRTVVEVMLVKACRLAETVELKKLVDRLTALEQQRGPRSVGKTARKPVEEPAKEPAAPPAQTFTPVEPVQSLDDVRARWQQVTGQTIQASPQLRPVVSLLQVEAMDEGSLTLSLPEGYEHQWNAVRQETFGQLLGEALRNVCGRVFDVSYVPRQHQEDPAVMAIVKLFDGSVIQRSTNHSGQDD